ncbi:hypothetical protein SPBR_04006 [Sporothrix brasiliensis 5110]|uniref:BTB domain-containing protein n=1 Tax=Sporothrix brasiliensis 5110 TaxID=1398154 RepID=A0A0C2J1Y2_9PEZI|nr:uncharacterized protein SPBR_04006 [Sporothrix brasiliensis 5110]KIH95326.1 hypothetical protein SPBR_04006 [Sporothrix brasiliensis 5110]
MIQFMYGKKIGILGSESSCDQQMPNETDTEDSIPAGKPPRSDLQDLMRLSTIADYYDVATLRAQVNLEIRAVLSNAWVPTDFIVAAKMAYAATRDVELHNVFVEFAARNMESLWIHFDKFVELFQLPGFVAEFKKQSGNLFKPTATELQLLRTFAADMESAFNGKQRRYCM